MTALPIEPPPEDDPLDPERILQALPEQERATFLAQYQHAVDAAHDPAGWKHLRRLLRLWAMRAIAEAQPGYYGVRDLARGGEGDGMPLEDTLRQYQPGLVSYRPWLEDQALWQMSGLPVEALDLLARAMARICEDPYDRLLSVAIRDDVPQEWMAGFGDLGFMEFEVNEAAGLVHVYTIDLGWLDMLAVQLFCCAS